jgi:hypothetical protein
MKYTVKPTSRFKRDYKALMRRGLRIELLDEVIARPRRPRDRRLSRSKPWEYATG